MVGLKALEDEVAAVRERLRIQHEGHESGNKNTAKLPVAVLTRIEEVDSPIAPVSGTGQRHSLGSAGGVPAPSLSRVATVPTSSDQSSVASTDAVGEDPNVVRWLRFADDIIKLGHRDVLGFEDALEMVMELRQEVASPEFVNRSADAPPAVRPAEHERKGRGCRGSRRKGSRNRQQKRRRRRLLHDDENQGDSGCSGTLERWEWRKNENEAPDGGYNHDQEECPGHHGRPRGGGSGRGRGI